MAKKRHKGKGKKKGAGLREFLNYEAPLSPRGVKRGSKALTRLELLPALRGYQREANTLGQMRGATEQGLYNVLGRTSGAVSSAYGNLAASSAQNQATQQAIASALNARTSEISGQASQNLQSSQTGALGNLTADLSAQNVDASGSASGLALAQQVQAQNQAAAQRAQAEGSFANTLGSSWQGLASQQANAAQMQGTEARSNIAQLIADRIAESNLDYNASIREALGKKADTKALWGATRLKNLLQLRGSEREYSLAKNPPTSRNVNVYKGLNKKGTARAQVTVAQLQKQAQQLRQQGNIAAANKALEAARLKAEALKKYGQSVGGGGGGKKKPRRR